MKAIRFDSKDKIARAAQTADNMVNIEQFCELARRNIDTFTDEYKKLAVRALDVQVHVYAVNIEGIIRYLRVFPLIT